MSATPHDQLAAAKDALFDRDFGKARAPLEEAAKAGMPEALYLLGALNWRGRGMERSAERARGLFDAAAQGGWPAAHHALGVLAQRANAPGARRDDAAAAFHFRKAAEAGHPAGMRAFARCCSSGRGVAQDLAEAARWRRAAAEAGDVQAMIDQGLATAGGAAGAPDPVAGLALLYAAVARSGDGAARRAALALARTMVPADITRAQRRGEALAAGLADVTV